MTLYEKAFPLSEQRSKSAHDQFLVDLACILPENTIPLIVNDAGFKVPCYKSVERHGWHWLSPAYGLGLRHNRTSNPERFELMLLIALMLQLTFWLAGVHAQKQGWNKHFQANTIRNRNVLST